MFKGMTFRRLFICAYLAINYLSSCTENTEELTPGISLELAEYRNSVISDVVYDLNFNLPEDPDVAINAELKLSFTLSSTDRDLVLDFNAGDELVQEVQDENGPVPFSVQNEHLVIKREALASHNHFYIKFIAGDRSLNRKENFLYSLFVPAKASSCFPVFDQPDIKAKYRLTLQVPAAWSAISNGPSHVSDSSSNRKKITFQETLPISSYLFAFAAGEFQAITKEINGRELTMYHRETDQDRVERNSGAIFDWHIKSLEWLEEYTGIPYPFGKFHFVLLPSFQFGGMEHPGAIFYKSSSLFLDESHTLTEELRRARLIAHETAHMWFGDLVTMKWFDDVWLKEVFANFMAAKIVQPNYPQINHDLQFIMSHYPGAYAVDRTQGSHPIQQPLDNLKAAGSLYGAIIYQKAPIVMRMLEDNMGEQAFQTGIRTYLEKYQFANASWDDLIGILSQNTDYKLDRWNNHWVKSPEMPHIRYNMRQKRDTINKFDLFTYRKDEQSNIWWPQKLELLLGWADSAHHIEVNKTSRRLNVAEGIGLPFPEYVFTNSDGAGYGYFSMKSASIEYYLENIHEETDEVIRGAVWMSLYENMLYGKVDPERFAMALMNNIVTEQEPLIVSYLMDVLKQTFWIYLNDNQRDMIIPRLEGVLLNRLLSTENDNLRTTYFRALTTFTFTAKGTQLLHSIYLDKMEIPDLLFSENDKIKLAYELAVREVEGCQRLMEDRFQKIENPDRRDRMRFVMQALSADEQDRDTFFNSLKDVVNRSNEEWVLEALYYLHHPLRTSESAKYIKESLELLEEIAETGDIFFPKRWLDRTLENHQSEEAEDAVRQFLYDHNKYRSDLKNKLLQSSDHLFRSENVRQSWGELKRKESLEDDKGE